jgi:hypothetical protein
MKRAPWLLHLLVLLGLACSLSQPAAPASTPPGAAPVVGGQPAAQSNTPCPECPACPTAVPTEVPTPTPEPTPTPVPSNPIGLWRGLSSLNSYRLTIRSVGNGPTAQDRSEITVLVEVGSDGDSSHTRYEITTSSAEDPEVTTSVSEQYRVGTRSCEIDDDGEIETSTTDPQQQEMAEVWLKLVDLVPGVNDPVYVGQEVVNGVITNHFTFAVSGLGVDSGAEVVASSGEYWLAVDGQYIVKYTAVLETRSGPVGDPNTEVMHSEFFIEVRDINQSIVITLPGGCQ